jgi:hypothetical protein
MKPRSNQTRRAGNAFRRMDPSGYVIRFARAKDGCWCAKPDAFVALSGARTLRQVKKLASEAVQICLADYVEMGWPIPNPDRGSYAS